MKLSVIIPVYNERPYIEKVLQRVMEALPQVEKEIVIVDDGSTDGTREWLSATFGDTNPHPVTVLMDRGKRLASVLQSIIRSQ